MFVDSDRFKTRLKLLAVIFKFSFFLFIPPTTTSFCRILNTPSAKMNNKQKSGQIQVIFGPMFSGKTTELLRRIRRYTVANRSCLVIKYKNDTRYSNEDMATHDRYKIKPITCANCTRQMWSAFPTDRLSDAVSLARSVEVIGIDEGQFVSF